LVPGPVGFIPFDLLFGKGAVAMLQWIENNFILWVVIMLAILGVLVFVLIKVRSNQDE
jgi:hypothetical protein